MLPRWVKDPGNWIFVGTAVVLAVFMWAMFTDHWQRQACEEYGQAYSVQTNWSGAAKCLVIREGRPPVPIDKYIDNLSKG